MPSLGLIVEGDGDVEAIPLLLRKILHADDIFHVQLSRPVRVGGLHNILNSAAFSRQFQYVLNDPSLDGILLCVDCDDGCPLTTRSQVLTRISDEFGALRIPLAIVLINSEFEALFLSQADHLTSHASFFDAGERAAHFVANCSNIRNAKGAVASCITEFSYKEARDQARLAAHLDIALLPQRHRAGRRLSDAVTQVLGGVSDV